MNTRARKRLFHEVADFASVTTPHPNANIHAAVTTLSPVKKGQSSIYFDRTLTDGTSKMCMVGFSSDQRKKLVSFADSSQSVQLINCKIKQSREGDKMEIILKKFTDIKKSPKDINTSNLDPTDTADTSSEITLDKISEIQVFQRVTVAAKVLNLSEPICVASGKRKQDAVISDCTNTSRLTVWEEDIGTLQVNNSYRFEHMVVHEFNQRRYLSKARQRSTITQIDNIGDVEDFSDSDAENDSNQIFNLTLFAVPRLDSYKACMHCKAR